MDRAKRIIFCCAQNLRKWPSNLRIYVLALLLIAFLSTLVRPIAAFSATVNVPTAPWIFPYLALDPTVLLLLMLGIVLLFCDAPFIDAHQPYVIIRSGKRDWLLGQILYIMATSAVYFLFITLNCVLMLLPDLAFSSDWGKILGTLAQTNAGNAYDIHLPVSYQLQLQYTPAAAMIWSLFINWMVGTFLGLFMFVCNMRLPREIGAVAASLLVLLQYFCWEADGFIIFHFSPVSWASLGNLDITHLTALPSNTFAVCALVGLNLILILLANLFIKKMDMDILPPV